jgi:hypothetical protein
MAAKIDENLIRGKLSPADEAILIGRRKELYEFEFPDTKAGGDRRSNGKVCHLKNDAFSKATARATGKAERTVRLAAHRGKALGCDLHHGRQIGVFFWVRLMYGPNNGGERS